MLEGEVWPRLRMIQVGARQVCQSRDMFGWRPSEKGETCELVCASALDGWSSMADIQEWIALSNSSSKWG